MKIILTEISIITQLLELHFIKNYNEKCFGYAEKVCEELFGDLSLHYLVKLNINSFDTVFIGSESFSVIINKKFKKINSIENKIKYGQVLFLKEILKGKPVYICKLINEKGYFEFSFPELVYFELSESIPENKKIKKIRKKLDKANIKNKNKKPAKINVKKIQTYLLRINLNSLKNLINLAKRDFDFIERFNNEMFHQNINYNNKILTRDEVKTFYETEHFMKIIDLSDIRERIAFISLYGITFNGLELSDFYSINGIFSLQANRSRDDLKQLSGKEVFALILSRDKKNIIEIINEMGETLLNLALPILNLNDYNLLKQNYPLYCGIADIGRLFIRLAMPEIGGSAEKYHRTATRMIDYSLAESYFDFILKCDVDFDLENNHIYETLLKFEAVVRDKKTAVELSHGSKEFKL